MDRNSKWSYVGDVFLITVLLQINPPVLSNTNTATLQLSHALFDFIFKD